MNEIHCKRTKAPKKKLPECRSLHTTLKGDESKKVYTTNKYVGVLEFTHAVSFIFTLPEKGKMFNNYTRTSQWNKTEETASR